MPAEVLRYVHGLLMRVPGRPSRAASSGRRSPMRASPKRPAAWTAGAAMTGRQVEPGGGNQARKSLVELSSLERESAKAKNWKAKLQDPLRPGIGHERV